MDFLNPIINQLRELFAAMTPGARLTAGLLVAVVVVSLGFLFQQATVGPDEYLFGGDPIGRGRLPRMEAALGSAGIDYDTDGARIRVSRANKNAAIAAIADAGELPPEFHSLMNKALDGGGMFEPREMKLARLRAAAEQRASLILSEMPWIDNARVIHNVRQTSGLNGGRHATAAVSITPQPGEVVNSRRLRTVKDFVTKALDVAPEHVSVTNTNGDLASDDSIVPEDFDHPRFRLQAQRERLVRSAILDQLDFIPGVRVQVKATIDPISEKRVVSVAPEKEPVTLSQSKSDTSSEQTVNHNSDRVGAEANGPNGVPRDNAIARQDKRTEKTKLAESMSAVGSTKTETITSGFELKEVDTSIAVPLSYVEAVYQREHPDDEDFEKAKFDTIQSSMETQLENIVQPLLPRLSLGEDKFRQVKVSFFRDLPQEPVPGPSVAATALGWLSDYGDTLAMFGLATFSLVMLRSIVSGANNDGGPVQGLPSLQLDGEELAESNDEEEDAQRPKLKLRKADTLKDDLSEMVSSDPDAAAAILRAWINNNAA